METTNSENKLHDSVLEIFRNYRHIQLISKLSQKFLVLI